LRIFLATITFPSSALASLTPCVRRYFGFFPFYFFPLWAEIQSCETSWRGYKKCRRFIRDSLIKIPDVVVSKLFSLFIRPHCGIQQLHLLLSGEGLKITNLNARQYCLLYLPNICQILQIFFNKPLIFANLRLNREWRQRKATEEDGNE